MKIYLDDIREPLYNEWVIIRNGSLFKEIISNYLLDLPYENPTLTNIEISFDHDLAEEHYTVPPSFWLPGPAQYDICETGYDCAQWIVDNNIILKMFWVHSANPVGSENIIHLLNNWYKWNNIDTRGYRTFWPTK